MTDLYQKIDVLCKRKGITRSQFCRDTGVSQATVTDLKMGRKKGLSARRLSIVADYFNVPIANLLPESTDWMLRQEKASLKSDTDSKSVSLADDSSIEQIIQTRVALMSMSKKASEAATRFTASYPELFSDVGWKQLSQKYRENHQSCERCGAESNNLNVHHIRPIKYGYPTICEDKWLIALCPACHRFVHSSANTGREFIVLPDGETL